MAMTDNPHPLWRREYEKHGYECAMQGISAMSFDAWLMQRADSVISELRKEIGYLLENNVSKSSYEQLEAKNAQLAMRIKELEMVIRGVPRAEIDAAMNKTARCTCNADRPGWPQESGRCTQCRGYYGPSRGEVETR